MSVLGPKINLLREEGVGSRLPPLQPWGRDGQGMLGGKVLLLLPATRSGAGVQCLARVWPPSLACLQVIVHGLWAFSIVLNWAGKAVLC